MMDEYIPAPRPTPNKPRRMRDLSSMYPVDETKLLFEGILKRQREKSSGDAGRGRGRLTDIREGDNALVGRQRLVWREDRCCPVCRWVGKSSASSGSEYDGDESDDTSNTEDPSLLESSSVTSDTGDEEEDDAVKSGEDNSEDEEEHIVHHTEDSEDDRDIVLNDRVETLVNENEKDPVITDTSQVQETFEESSRSPPHDDDSKEQAREKDIIPKPGKLLYGRHCLWYQSAGFIRPQGGK